MATISQRFSQFEYRTVLKMGVCVVVVVIPI